MEENVVEIVEVSTELPMIHQLGKMLFATAVAFGASKLAEKGYVSGLHKFWALKAARTEG
jgi:hypothetical protein